MDKNDYTGWKELNMCLGGIDGHKCRTWLETVGDIKNAADKGGDEMEQERVEKDIYVEVAVPELDHQAGKLQKFLIVGSCGDSQNVTLFLGGSSITVSTELLRRACFRATDVGSPY